MCLALTHIVRFLKRDGINDYRRHIEIFTRPVYSRGTVGNVAAFVLEPAQFGEGLFFLGGFFPSTITIMLVEKACFVFCSEVL